MIRPNLQISREISVERQPRFMKYPGHIGEQTLTNLAYAKTTITNIPPSGFFRRIKAKGRGTAHVAITLRAMREGQPTQEFRLLWLISEHPTTAPLARGDSLPIHFLTIDAEGREILIPTVSRGDGQWTGDFLPPGNYSLALRWTGGEWIEMGQYNLPEDILLRAREAEVARFAQEHGGYCVYFDSIEGGVRANCKGTISEERRIRLADEQRPTQILVNDQVWTPPSPGNFY